MQFIFLNTLLAASLWTWVETRMIMNRMAKVPGAPSKRGGYPFALPIMAHIAAASTVYRILICSIIVCKPSHCFVSLPL